MILQKIDRTKIKKMMSSLALMRKKQGKSFIQNKKYKKLFEEVVGRIKN